MVAEGATRITGGCTLNANCVDHCLNNCLFGQEIIMPIVPLLRADLLQARHASLSWYCLCDLCPPGCLKARHGHCLGKYLVTACRVLLTDLNSLNGTWVNRAKLRPHADSQIQAQDVIAFGSSTATFQLMAIDAEASQLPSSLKSAEAILQVAGAALQHQLPEPEHSQDPYSDAGLLLNLDSLLTQYKCSASRPERLKHLLQVCSSLARGGCGTYLRQYQSTNSYLKSRIS